MKSIRGLIYYCGDYVNTDVMAPGRFDPIYERDQLSKIALIDYVGQEPLARASGGEGDFKFIVAGRDFGCGSSRETAPMALAAAGIRVVVAQSFARIFFRNCINLGEIYPIALDHDFDLGLHRKQGEFDFSNRRLKLNEHEFLVPELGDVERIFKMGGLSAYVKKVGGLV